MCLTSHSALLSLWLVLDVMCGVGRNLSHPVAQQLESLVEQFNPEYNRKNKQRTKEVWGPKLMKGKFTEAANGYPGSAGVCKVAVTPAHTCKLPMYVYGTPPMLVLARQCCVAATHHGCSRVCFTTPEVKLLCSMGSRGIAMCRWPLQSGGLLGACKPSAYA